MISQALFPDVLKPSTPGIIHSYAQARKVVEHSLDGVWKKNIIMAYRFKEFANP